MDRIIAQVEIVIILSEIWPFVSQLVQQLVLINPKNVGKWISPIAFQRYAFQEPVLMQHPHYQNPLAVILNVRPSYQIVFGMVNRQGDALIPQQHAHLMLEVLLNVVYFPNKDALKPLNFADQHLALHLP